MTINTGTAKSNVNAIIETKQEGVEGIKMNKKNIKLEKHASKELYRIKSSYFMFLKLKICFSSFALKYFRIHF